MKNVQLVYCTLVKILYDKTQITLAETQHIYRSVVYALDIENYIGNENNMIGETLGSLAGGMRELIGKLEDQIAELEGLQSGIINEIDIRSNHLNYFVFIDCIQSRSYQLAEKLQYFSQAYENVIEDHRFPFLPRPSINKRILTSNRTLYFNRELKNVLNKDLKSFFRIESGDDKKVLSTWAFVENDHLKEIENNTNNEYVSFSFWFYELFIFYPLSYHEIAHAVYKSDHHYHWKLRSEDEEELSLELLPYAPNWRISKSFFYSLHEEIVCDLSAMSIAGVGYIFALFYTAFFENFHKLFTVDLVEKSIFDAQRIDDSNRKCKTQIESIVMNAWEPSLKFTTMFVRLTVLIYAYEKLYGKADKNNENTKALKGIKEILEMVYPDDVSSLEGATFADIVKKSPKNYKHYEMHRNITLLLGRLFQKHHLIRTLISNIDATSYSYPHKEFFEKIYNKNERLDNYLEIPWLLRHKEFEDIKRHIPTGRFLRIRNMFNIGLKNYINNLDKEEIDKRFYELIFFKFSKKIQLAKLKDHFSNVQVALSCFDFFAIERRVTYDVDALLGKLDGTYKFFTERHALFCLYENDGASEDHHQIKIDAILSIGIHQDKDKEFMKFCMETFEQFGDAYSSLKIFKSMGYEDYLLYLKGVDICKAYSISDQFYASEITNQVQTTLGISDVDLVQNSICGKVLAMVKFKTINIECLKEKLDEVLGAGNFVLHSIYGMYDVKILFSFGVFLDFYKKLLDEDGYPCDIIDIQFEYQIEQNQRP